MIHHSISTGTASLPSGGVRVIRRCRTKSSPAPRSEESDLAVAIRRKTGNQGLSVVLIEVRLTMHRRSLRSAMRCNFGQLIKTKASTVGNKYRTFARIQESPLSIGKLTVTRNMRHACSPPVYVTQPLDHCNRELEWLLAVRVLSSPRHAKPRPSRKREDGSGTVVTRIKENDPLNLAMLSSSSPS